MFHNSERTKQKPRNCSGSSHSYKSSILRQKPETVRRTHRIIIIMEATHLISTVGGSCAFRKAFPRKASENLFKIISIVRRYEEIFRLPSLRSNERTDVRSVGSCINLIPVTCFGRKQLPTVKQKAD